MAQQAEEGQLNAPAHSHQTRSSLFHNFTALRQSKKYSKWQHSESYAYITFLEVCTNLLEDSSKRKALKIYKHLTKLIPTRSHLQIKSHHQKMMTQHYLPEEIWKNCKPQIQHYVEQSHANRSEIEAVSASIADFFREQNRTKAFRDLNVVVVWTPEYGRESRVKVQVAESKVMVEEQNKGYIMFSRQEEVGKQDSIQGCNVKREELE